MTSLASLGMVVGLRPPPRATFPDGNRSQALNATFQPTDLREPVEDTLCPSGTACPACVKRLRTHRVRGAISWRGQALRFAPLPLCLSRRASDGTDPAISPALDGLKFSRLSRSSRFSTALRFGRHFSRKNDSCRARTQPASQAAGFRVASQSGGHGRSERHVLRCMTMYARLKVAADAMETKSSHLRMSALPPLADIKRFRLRCPLFGRDGVNSGHA